MHSVSFLQDLAVVMIMAGVVTVIFHRFKQPVVLGYIVAGFIIGPRSPPFELITSEESINTLAEIGVVLLMFSLGLEFSLRKLKQVGGTAVIAATLEIFGMGWVGYELAGLFGWSTTDRLFLGAMLSMSSTTIIIKVLTELGQTKERFAQLVFGILILEDILGIAMIALLSGIGMTGSLSIGAVGITLGKLGIFLVVALVAGLIMVPRLLGYVARFKSNEMLLITVLGLCFGVSLLAAKLGYSVALGAFVIGALIAESREVHRIATLIEPVRDMFSAVFFVAIGLLIEPKMLVVHWLPILAITVAVIGCKVVACASGTFLGGNDSRTSVRVGMSVAQIGEFSFIIASLGVTLKVTSDFLYPIAVAVSAITTLLTPYLIKSADGMVDWYERVAPRPLTNSFELYTQWVGRLGSQRHGSMATRLTRLWLLQVALNAVLMAGVFLAVVYVAKHPPGWFTELGFSVESANTLLWLTALIASLPMFIAASRKLQALGLLIAETKVTKAAAGEHTQLIQGIVARVVPIAGTAFLGLYMLILTSALLPTLRVLLVLLALVGFIAWLLRRSFIRVYSKAQVALLETFAHPPPPAHVPGTVSNFLRDAVLETIAVNTGSPAAGKLIRELQLRTQTGASIIGIQRGRASLINPGPDEEIQTGDELLLLGTSVQITAARKALSPG
jgi:CPA2 family monovalent cation:H+ antiporter-2